MNRSRDMCDEAERFVQDVDLLLARQPVEKTTDDAYQADLELAHLLGRVQFVPDSRFKCRLRSHLLHQLREKEVKAMSPIRVFRSLFRPVLVTSLSAILVLGVVFAVSPDVRAQAQEWLARFVEVDSSWALRPVAEKRPALPAVPAAPNGETGESEAVAAPAGEETGESEAVAAPAGEETGESHPTSTASSEGTGDSEAFSESAAARPEERSSKEPSARPLAPSLPPVPDHSSYLISLQDAQAKVSFTIRMPSTLPEGYQFLGVMPMPELPADAPKIDLPADAPKIEPPQMVLLVFGNSADERLTLSEARMANPASIEVPLPAGRGSVQEVTVNGQPAQYVEGMWTRDGWVSDGHYQLHWQDAEGIMFDLTSHTLRLEALLAVAESIK